MLLIAARQRGHVAEKRYRQQVGDFGAVGLCRGYGVDGVEQQGDVVLLEPGRYIIAVRFADCAKETR